LRARKYHGIEVVESCAKWVSKRSRFEKSEARELEEKDKDMKQNRPWIYLALTLVGGIIGGALSSHLWPAPNAVAAEKQAKVITAGKFVLTDSGGLERALLSTEQSGGVSLVLNDVNGKERAEFRVGPKGGASVGFFDETGNRLVGMGTASDGRAGIGIYAPDGKVVAGFSTTPTGDTGLTLFDRATGLARLGLGVAPTGEPALLLMDKNGIDRAEMSLRADGKPGVAFADEKGKTVAGYPQLAPSN
jgi:hypothetical protein